MPNLVSELVSGKRFVKTETTFPVINPANAEVLGQCPEASPTQIVEIIDEAQRAWPAWSVIPWQKRQEYLMQCASAIEQQQETLVNLLTLEQGKPIQDARTEVFLCAQSFRATAQLTLNDQIIEESPQRKVSMGFKPLGVVGAITPWNFPLVLAAWKIAPALLAGNAIVVKPSPFTPFSTLELGKILNQVLLDGVLHIVTGNGEQGEILSGHPAIRKISFTGSTAVGKLIAQEAGKDLKRITLELGGNDAAILLDDVSIPAIAAKIFWGAMINNGQTCVAIKRVYVPASKSQELVDELVKIAAEVRVGDGMESDTQLGPICHLQQFKRVKSLVDEAVTKGAKIACGGRAMEDKAGYFFEPTILTDVPSGCAIIEEEQFGPVLPIIPYQDVEEVLVAVNKSKFGLGGSVWTSDLNRGAALARQLDCGTAWVNAHPDFCMQAPFGGCKWSGVGVENGIGGLEAYSQIQVLNAHPID